MTSQLNLWHTHEFVNKVAWCQSMETLIDQHLQPVFDLLGISKPEQIIYPKPEHWQALLLWNTICRIAGLAFNRQPVDLQRSLMAMETSKKISTGSDLRFQIPHTFFSPLINQANMVSNPGSTLAFCRWPETDSWALSVSAVPTARNLDRSK